MCVTNWEIYNSINKQKNIFEFFDEVYLFGSSLNTNIPNDVDLLLVYECYSDTIQKEKEKIIEFFEVLLNLETNVLCLSTSELTQTKFLTNTQYYKKIV
jgi:predicted nucleotidyltransferase